MKTLTWLARGAAIVAIAACSKGGNGGTTTSSASGDSAFKGLASEVLADIYKRHPSTATALGVHTFDDKLDDLSAGAFESEAAADSAFRARIVAVDTATLSLDQQLDH